MALANPLLDFDDLLFVKRVPGSFTHMSDQYYGWFSRPGGGVFVLEDFKSDQPRLRCLTDAFPPGTFLRPDLSHDGTRVLFAYCKYYPSLKDEPNKLDKNNVPEDAFFHLYEMNLDGSGVRRLTHGKYDDFDGRYLPNGEIVFLSTRRGQYIQCGSESGHASRDGALPDCYVRCGGGPERPVAVYTLHVMTADGESIRQISPFEMFEWTPSIDNDGRILYARWDYVDRYNMPYMSLWSTLPDGSNAQAIFGNYTVNPHCVFEARRIPDSRKLIFTASAHHAFTGGCLVLLDAHRAADGEAAMTRLTPEVCFPESEGWPQTYFGSPFPLSENHYLTAWSAQPLPPGTPRPDWGMPGPANDLGLYLFDAFGNLNLIYRDPEIGSETPLPIRRRVPERLVHQPVAGQDASRGPHGRGGRLPGTARRAAGRDPPAAAGRRAGQDASHDELSADGPDARRSGKIRAGHGAGRARRFGPFPRAGGRHVLCPGVGRARRGRADDAQCHLRPARPDGDLHRLSRTAEHRAAEPAAASSGACALADRTGAGRLVAAAFRRPGRAGAGTALRPMSSAG